ncbi:hypothetical protein HK104_002900 [Borealophlyctis nickersoniae]|nr:hypothetical protein HK104_002900 [Borealophlyctis nickersoniae]
MPNLYFFRHVITRKVLVSPMFQMQDKILRQIGEHRHQLQIRPDHWTPFAVLSGIKYPSTVLSLKNQIIPYVVDGCAFSKYRLPVGKNLRDPMLKWVDPLGEWTIPEGIIEKTVDLCKALHTNQEVQQELAELEAAAVPKREGKADSNLEGEEMSDLNPYEEFGLAYTLHLEREEYRDVIDREEGLVWPSFVGMEKLKMVRGRIPIVPELDWKNGGTENLEGLLEGPPERPRRKQLPNGHFESARFKPDPHPYM